MSTCWCGERGSRGWKANKLQQVHKVRTTQQERGTDEHRPTRTPGFTSQEGAYSSQGTRSQLLLFATANYSNDEQEGKNKKQKNADKRQTAHTKKEWIPTHNKTSGVRKSYKNATQRLETPCSGTHIAVERRAAREFLARGHAPGARYERERERGWGGGGNVTEAEYLLYHSQYDRMIPTRQSMKKMLQSASHILFLLLPLHPLIQHLQQQIRQGRVGVMSSTIPDGPSFPEFCRSFSPHPAA